VSYDDLSLVSQLNIDADAIATTELQEYGSLKPTVPFDPTSLALVHINGNTITKDFNVAIQNHLFTLPLKGYLCERFSWHHDVWDLIDWGAYSSVYSKFDQSKTFFYKFGWKKLPCGARLHKREP
jgi:hypothetical protein